MASKSDVKMMALVLSSRFGIFRDLESAFVLDRYSDLKEQFPHFMAI
jgi:hypothetical protein